MSRNSAGQRTLQNPSHLPKIHHLALSPMDGRANQTPSATTLLRSRRGGILRSTMNARTSRTPSVSAASLLRRHFCHRQKRSMEAGDTASTRTARRRQERSPRTPHPTREEHPFSLENWKPFQNSAMGHRTRGIQCSRLKGECRVHRHAPRRTEDDAFRFSSAERR